MSESPYPRDLATMPKTDSRTDADGLASGVHPQALTDRMAQGAHHTIDRLVETAGPHTERMEGALAGATGQLKDQARQVRQKGDEWADDLRVTVRRHPLSSVVAALAIGAMIVRVTR